MRAITSKEDLNNDGVIDIEDLAIIASKYNLDNKNKNWNKKLDINNHWVIDIFDLINISKLL